jgi:hypothetical protein
MQFEGGVPATDLDGDVSGGDSPPATDCHLHLPLPGDEE